MESEDSAEIALDRVSKQDIKSLGCRGEDRKRRSSQQPQVERYDPVPTRSFRTVKSEQSDSTISEFRFSASEAGSSVVTTRDTDELISDLNRTCQIETLQWEFSQAGQRDLDVGWRTNEAAAVAREQCFDTVFDAIGRCQSLRKLQISGTGLNIEQLQHLCQSLLHNQVEDLTFSIQHLDNFSHGLGDEGVRTICEMMVMNHSLKCFTLHDAVVTASTSASLGSMLAKNSTLESLDLKGCQLTPCGVEVLLQPLTGDGDNLPLNRTLKHLQIPGYGCEPATKAVVDMLVTNDTLTHLVLHEPVSEVQGAPMQPSMQPSDVCMILQSLKTNKTLQQLTIEQIGYMWEFQGRKEVFAGIMDLLKVNCSLTVNAKALLSPKEESIKAQLAENLENVEKKLHDAATTSQQIPIEAEVSQPMQEIKPFNEIEAAVNKLKECFSSMDGFPGTEDAAKRHRVGSAGSQVPMCKADGCKADLRKAEHYHCCQGVCEVHSKAPKVVVAGRTQRFCQQCSRFHFLVEFDEGKRTCRKRLASHNRRRRKPQISTLTCATTSECQRMKGVENSDLTGSNLIYPKPMLLHSKACGSSSVASFKDFDEQAPSARISIDVHEDEDILTSFHTDNQSNMTSTILLSSTNMNLILVQWARRAFNLITKFLKIGPLPKVHQHVEDRTTLHGKLVNVKQSLENACQQNPESIIVAAEIELCQQRVKFLFANPQGMATTAGVALDYAIVFWTRTNEILVEGIEEEEWLTLWAEAFTRGNSCHGSIITYMPQCNTEDIVTNELECDKKSKDNDWDVILSRVATQPGQVCLLNLIGTFFMTASFLNHNFQTHHDNSTEGSLMNIASTSTCLNVGEGTSNGCHLVNDIIDESKWPTYPLQDLWNQFSTCGHEHLEDDGDGERNNGDNSNGSNGCGLGDEGGCGKLGGGSNDGLCTNGKSSGDGYNGVHGGDGSGGSSGGSSEDGGGGNDGDAKSPNFNSRKLIAQKALVKVEPGLARGYWMDRKHQTQIQDSKVLEDAHLQHVRIEPRMSFEFLVDENGFKTIQTSISVNFDLKGAILDVSDTKHFGWFQREVIVSLECSNNGAAKVGHGDRVLNQEAESQKKTFKENAQTTSGINQYSIGGKVSGGVHIIQLEGNGGVSKSTGRKASLQEHTTEVPLKQILGGFCPMRLTSGPSLSYRFFAPNYPIDITEVATERSRNEYMNSITGLCSPVCPKIMGTWYELKDDNGSYLYMFKAQRIVCELKTKRTILGMTKSNRREFDQVYIVKMYVNHKMTHICKFKQREFALRAGESDTCGLLKVGEIHQSDPHSTLAPVLSPISHPSLGC